MVAVLHCGCGRRRCGRIGGGYGESHHGNADNRVGDVGVCREAPPCAGGGR